MESREENTPNRRDFLRGVVATAAASALPFASRVSARIGDTALLPKATLVLAGGFTAPPDQSICEMAASHPDDDIVDPVGFQRNLLKLNNTPGRQQKVVCITLAHKQDKTKCESNQWYMDVFSRFKAKVHLISDVTQFRESKSIKALEDADVIFFGGGDQEELYDAFMNNVGGRRVLALIQKRIWEDEHLVVGGTSAGAMVWSKRMIANNMGGTPPVDQDGENLGGPHYPRTSDGFALCQAMINTHLDKKDKRGNPLHREISLKRAMQKEKLRTGQDIFGIGIDEGVALVIKNGHAHVMGTGPVCAPEEADSHGRVILCHTGDQAKDIILRAGQPAISLADMGWIPHNEAVTMAP